MPCLNPVSLWRFGKTVFYNLPTDLVGLAEPFKVRCGHCFDCQLQYSRLWSARCLAELSQHQKSCFLTLTYRDEECPPALDMSDLQKFWKRLRKSGARFRYFACGEYGERTHRPHYHAIVFGWSPLDLRTDYVSSDNGLSRVQLSDSLSRIWFHGNVAIGNVSAASCAYVARYCTKKLTPAALGDRRREFVVMSRRPAIGWEFMKKFKNNIVEYDAIFNGKIFVKPPRVFDKLLSDSELESLRARRVSRSVDYSDEDLSRRSDYLSAVWKKKRAF